LRYSATRFYLTLHKGTWTFRAPVSLLLEEATVVHAGCRILRLERRGSWKRRRKRKATGWTVRGSNPGGSEIFCTRPDGPWGSPSPPPIQWVPDLFLGSKAAGAWRWPPTPSSAEVKERVELYLYSTSGHLWPVVRWTLPLPYCFMARDVSRKCQSQIHGLLEHRGRHSHSNVSDKCFCTDSSRWAIYPLQANTHPSLRIVYCYVWRLFNLLTNFKTLGLSSELATLAVCLQRLDEYSFLCISILRLYSPLQYRWLSDRMLSASSADTLCPLLDWGLFSQNFHCSFFIFWFIW